MCSSDLSGPPKHKSQGGSGRLREPGFCERQFIALNRLIKDASCKGGHAVHLEIGCHEGGFTKDI